MGRERATSHIVGSLYNFNEAAGHKIVSSFRNNANLDASCQFDDANLFTVHTSHNDDESLAYIVNSIRNFISVEKTKEPDLFEDDKIIRKRGTHPSLTLASMIEKGAQAIKPKSEMPLIGHENIIRKWSPSSENKGLGSKLSLPLFGRIGNLCECRIEHASDSAELLIKADREQDIEKAISMLERLSKIMVDESSFPRVHSFYILEGEMSVKLQLSALRSLDDRRPTTTLLQKDLPTRSLRDLYVLTLVKGSDMVPVKIKPSASSQGSQLWNDHVSNCGQIQDLTTTETQKESETPIGKWVSEVTESDVQMDAFRPESAVTIQQSVGVEPRYEESLSSTKKATTRRARIPRGDPDALDKARVEVQEGCDRKEATTEENLAKFINRQPPQNISTKKESELRRPPPSIEPPYMPPLARSSRSLLKTPSITSQPLMPSSTTWNVVGRDSKSDNLIDMSVPNEERTPGKNSKDEGKLVIDSLQDIAKVKARDLRNTMNQRKAPTQALVGGDTALINAFEEAVIHMLPLALPRTGWIELAVDIGRLLIVQQCDSSEFKNRSFKTSEFPSVLPKGKTTGFEPVFTNMLTARSSDAESIVNIFLSQGRRLFQQQPAFKNVTYVFTCKAKGGDRIVVEIDEGRNSNIQGCAVLIGALDWHFPKRAWDARLRLSSETFLARDYQSEVKGIVDNLKIRVSENGQSLELWTKTVDDSLSIERITLRRETLHPATIYPDLILHLTECQEFQGQQPSDSESIYSASIQSSNVMAKANRLWWEAKLSSTRANSILKENMKLELGETATWTPSSIINNGVVRDLFAAAKEIVTQIDHVGFFNRGKGSSESKTTGKPHEISQDVPASLRRDHPAFW